MAKWCKAWVWFFACWLAVGSWAAEPASPRGVAAAEPLPFNAVAATPYLHYAIFALGSLTLLSILFIVWSRSLRRMVARRTAELEIENGRLRQRLGEQHCLAAAIEATDDLQKPLPEVLQALTSLHESETRFRMLLENTPLPFSLIEEGRFVDANRAALAMLGYRQLEELLGKSPVRISPERQPDGRHWRRPPN